MIVRHLYRKHPLSRHIMDNNMIQYIFIEYKPMINSDILLHS